MDPGGLDVCRCRCHQIGSRPKFQMSLSRYARDSDTLMLEKLKFCGAGGAVGCYDEKKIIL